ncbi:uncharacterized protein LOC129739642 [Uranotaenia lowii]|uniref:uncharacterized protein LOC129739642 n=1 Tax=Uranotaenia lowii TaxID=190385 RepID=UPI00247B126D|nr:uncharacterized protein LOC129739642 [Uranotaenia lowii]
MGWEISVAVVIFSGLQVLAGGYPYADSYPYSATALVTESKLLKGISNKASIEGAKDVRDFAHDHVNDQGGRINSAADAVRYHALDNQINGHRIADSSKGGSVDKIKHLAGEKFETDKSHNRKQIKSGFSNSYHKDESGSKSSFYEDSDDHGGKQIFDNRQNLRDNYNDHLYNKELRNDHLKDRYDDRYGGADLRGVRDFHHQTAADRGNLRDYRDGFRDDRDHNLRTYGHEMYPAPYGHHLHQHPLAPVRHYDDLYHRKTFYEPRPAFNTGPFPRPAITVYEDPRYPTAIAAGGYGHDLGDERFRRLTTNDDDGRHPADRFQRRFDEDFADRTRLIFRPSPLLNYRRP